METQRGGEEEAMAAAEQQAGEIEIEINGLSFRVPAAPISGSELRRLSTPAVGSDQDLLQITVSAGESDLLIHDEQVVDFENGARFVSVPRRILAG
jgi:hypothetical protein